MKALFVNREVRKRYSATPKSRKPRISSPASAKVNKKACCKLQHAFCYTYSMTKLPKLTSASI